MTPGDGKRSATAGGAKRSLNLIHRSNSPNPVLARAVARSYSLECGVSQAVIDAAFSIAIRLHQGGYERTS